MTLLLDDFTDADLVAGSWSVFSDRVMGGVSDARAAHEVVAGRMALRLSGRVSLARHGGVQLAVCGVSGSYVVPLRTAEARAPWQYYGAELPVTPRRRMCICPGAPSSPNRCAHHSIRARLSESASRRRARPSMQ